MAKIDLLVFLSRWPTCDFNHQDVDQNENKIPRDQDPVSQQVTLETINSATLPRVLSAACLNKFLKTNFDYQFALADPKPDPLPRFDMRRMVEILIRFAKETLVERTGKFDMENGYRSEIWRLTRKGK